MRTIRYYVNLSFIALDVEIKFQATESFYLFIRKKFLKKI